MKIWDDTKLDIDKTVVVIGPNGSGKTKYGISLTNMNNCDHIGALRNIAIQEHLPMMSFPQAENEVKNQLRRRKQRYWEISGEIDMLFSKLMADDSSSATKFRDLIYKGETPELEKTKIMELKDLWDDLFPSRHISFDGYVPKVNSEYMSGNDYAARYMSDGERVALYLAARVLDANSKIIIIDEPEVHFHSKLSVLFWDTLEKLRPDKKFVYITHSLEFALSRKDPIFLLVKPEQQPKVIENLSDLPLDTLKDLLAAASLSIFAKRVIFCEGIANKSKDNRLLTAWFNDKNTAIVPLNSCKNVIEAVLSYKKTDIIQNLQIIGIIDQDYSSLEAIDAIKNDVFVLPLHEIESLILHEEIIKEVLVFLGKEEIDSTIREYKDKAKQLYSPELINNTISERFKKEFEFTFNYQIRGLKSNSKDKIQKKSHLEFFIKVKEKSEEIYTQCEKEVTDALNGEYIDLLKMLPGKPLSSLLFKFIGINAETYLNIVCKLINDNNGSVINCLKQFLPERKLE